jgi:hypothetical protein
MPKGRGRPRKEKPVESVADEILNKAEEGNNEEEVQAEGQEEVSNVSQTTMEPLGHGQCYFESPCGTIVIGDETRDHIPWFDPKTNQRILINKKR